MIFTLLAACAAPEYALGTVDPFAVDPALAPTADLGDGGAFAAWSAPVVDVAAPTDAPRTADSPRTPSRHGAAPAPDVEREEAFAVGPGPSPVADYLLVLDDSTSMRKALARLDAGLTSLLAPGVFPSGSRIAVLNTTPSDPDDPATPHPAVASAGADDLAPGFGRLVDAVGIAAYRKEAPRRYAREYAAAGCAAWFGPDDVDRDGVPCLFAHTRVPFLPKRAEAGLVALRQWLERPDRPRFRAGASVNVLFISDTHDPGLSPEGLAARGEDGADLLALQPDYALLRALVTEPVAGFRVHALAPETECGERWAQASYFDVADASDGVRADFCTTEDYAAVIGSIARAGSVPQEPVLRLGHPAAEVVEVRGADGPLAWSPTDDPQAIALAGELPERPTRVHVRYRTR